MISQEHNIQVRHHPESEHICAKGWTSPPWRSFGRVGIHHAAEMFVDMISSELTIGIPIRVQVRNEHSPNTVHDITVNTSIIHEAYPTFPERNALDYQDTNAGGETQS